MKKLIRKDLKIEQTINYFQDAIGNANKLSEEIIKLVDFKTGKFFTLLPEGANFENIYDFSDGNILTKNPDPELILREEIQGFSIIDTIIDETSKLILEKLSADSEISCIIDDVIRTKENIQNKSNLKRVASFFKDEVYYLLDKNNSSTEIISKCLESSNAFWHSLSILTNSKI